MKSITGQVIIRNTIKKDGKQLVIIAGIIAVDDSFPLEGEHQYTLVGRNTIDGIQLTIVKSFSKDLTDEMRGNSIDGILTSPVWRI